MVMVYFTNIAQFLCYGMQPTPHEPYKASLARRTPKGHPASAQYKSNSLQDTSGRFRQFPILFMISLLIVAVKP